MNMKGKHQIWNSSKLKNYRDTRAGENRWLKRYFCKNIFFSYSMFLAWSIWLVVRTHVKVRGAQSSPSFYWPNSLIITVPVALQHPENFNTGYIGPVLHQLKFPPDMISIPGFTLSLINEYDLKKETSLKKILKFPTKHWPVTILLTCLLIVKTQRVPPPPHHQYHKLFSHF